MTKIIIFGVSGMLGSTLLKYFSGKRNVEVIGTIRAKSSLKYLPDNTHRMVMSEFDVNDFVKVEKLLGEFKPTLVLNCVGIVKQLDESNELLKVLPINSIFPHKLAQSCAKSDCRLVHISTDCIFTGDQGMYKENDVPDALDLYGISKRLGEVTYPNTLTLRTSIIGHELNSNRSLVDWFLSQEGIVKGFQKAIFSGLPTIEIARIIDNYVIPNPNLSGIYQVSADPINKFELLSLIADVYGKNINIEKDSTVIIDRSLDSTKFRELTGYQPPSWRELVIAMRDFV